MLGLPDAVKILLFSKPADMRRGFDGLIGLVRYANEDVYSGHLFVFLSRSRNRVKILTFQRGGFILWYKRLERGTFRRIPCEAEKAELDATALSMLLDGIDISKVHRPAHWAPKTTSSRRQDRR